MIDQLIRTELRELDSLRDELPILFDNRTGLAHPGFRRLDQRYDLGLRRLEKLIESGSRDRSVTDAVLDALDWIRQLHEWRYALLRGVRRG
jgi:hypothetical protein